MKTRSVIKMLALLATFALFAVACSDDDSTDTDAGSGDDASGDDASGDDASGDDAPADDPPADDPPADDPPADDPPADDPPADETVSGDLIWWSDWTIEQTEAFIDEFNKVQPDINVEYLRSDDAEMFDRFSTQSAAGDVNADIVIIGWDGFSKIWDGGGFLHKYVSPHADAYAQELWGEGGSYYTYGSLLEGLCYNTEVLADEGLEPPLEWEDMADPKYDGLFTIQDPTKVGSGAHDLLIELRVFWDDDERWEAFFSGLGANNVAVQPSSTEAQQLVVQGEYGIDALCYLDFVQPSIDQGAPVVWVAPEPVITVPFTVNIPFSAPNKPAAEAFVDFILSEEGQAVVANVVGQVPARPGAPFPEPALVANGKTQIPALAIPRAVDEYENNAEFYVEKAKEWFDLR